MGNGKLFRNGRKNLRNKPMNKYAVKEIFGVTIQGEGAMIGTPTHFIRFSGCNMWDGRLETRAKSRCPYCDTDFVGGKKMYHYEIIDELLKLPYKCKWVTISGGEPGLQVDQILIDHLHGYGFKIAIETNGTCILPSNIDHICVSPKVPRNEMKLHKSDSLKLLYPHPNKNIIPEDFIDYNATDKYLQPIMDVSMFGDREDIFDESVKATLQKIYESNGFWKLSPQIHKLIKVR